MAVNTLLSFAYHGDVDLAAYRRSKRCGRLMIDSGAFTAFTTGKPVRLEEYAEYLERFRGQWDHAVTLDVIGDAAATARNTRILHARGLPVMPVFTRGGTLPDFDAMVRDHGYVCVGGLVKVHPTAQARRVTMLQRRARALGGGIHTLGIASMTTIRQARPYSADASTFTQVMKYGGIVWFDGEHLQQATVKDWAKLSRHRESIRDHGIDLATWQRTGRMPTGVGGGELRTNMLGAYAAADEHLVRTGRVPQPHGDPDDVPGTHLYVAAATRAELGYMAECDRRIHSPRPPRVFHRHGGDHHCHRPTTTGATT